jgi:hypothetical protein
MIRRTHHLTTLALAFLLAVVLAAPPLQAQGPGQVVVFPSEWKALEHSNGEKMAVGRYNTLHGVFEQGGFVRYVTSADGFSWTQAVTLSGSSSLAGLPTVAVDALGTVAVVWVGQYDPNTGTGRLVYAYKPLGGTWTSCVIVTDGTEPDITAHGNAVYITFTTFDRVQYISFPTQSPPTTPVAFGEEIDVNTCPNSRFVRPSIALEKRPCKGPLVKVAYLVENDEVGTPGLCGTLYTQVGPRVCTRNPNGTWGMEFSDVTLSAQPATGPEAVSLSFNSNQRDGHFFLAWSDEANGNTRTRLAHGKNANWSVIDYQPWNGGAHHVHVQARPDDTAARFLISMTDRDAISPGPFIDWQAKDQEGTWASGPAPTWSDPSPVALLTQAAPYIGHPQAQWWGRCTASGYTKMENFLEEQQACSDPSLTVDLEYHPSCPPSGGVVSTDPCDNDDDPAISTARMAGGVGLVDTAELGTRIEGGAGYAVYSRGIAGETFELTWSGGEPVFWDGGFSAHDLDGLLAVGPDGPVTVLDDGYLAEYDTATECLGDACGCDEDATVSGSGKS